MIKIDKNIPFVESKAYTSKYPFNKMNIGDSFLVEVQDERKIASAASYFGTRNSMKFSVRNTDKGLRCWRIA